MLGEEDLKVNCISAAIGLLIQHNIITHQELDKLTKTNYHVFYHFLMDKLIEEEFSKDRVVQT
ncbi:MULTISPECIES: hypothetical protein [Priestia]|jgi:hypothetical protein|uniref:Uncharacterized protein n=6 Tax=Priestia TaxID=2800373 RepID=A0A109GH76_PRIMG|nr:MULTISPECIES: hypothetical protein [Priestia]KRD99100.1 hypothetical protein ASE46_12410 [Bacillus sp. Root239]MBK0008789.1 hypothetical protein [Bacillus sp. S35]MBK0294242.1 hypothetical protein [Bacillus sp. S34]MBU8851630.1 hypothetical protein [Bacillus sp. FJAT-26377]MCJ7990044.1 hypothetical protein [Priestia sp. OVS21]MCL9635840.1 hypothetical protein [Bacillus zanthoxyli]NHH96046.1 hypothetical protein [Bacillus sp. MB95]RFB36492.1 hypothetical protein DZB86_15020 [Bacillus sp. 